MGKALAQFNEDASRWHVWEFVDERFFEAYGDTLEEAEQHLQNVKDRQA
jgi:hypothetical protein